MNKGFRGALVEAATQAFKNGTISRWDLLKIKLAILLRPKLIDELQAAVTDMAVEQGLCATGDVTAAAFDWTTLIALFIQLMPLILALIEQFS